MTVNESCKKIRDALAADGLENLEGSEDVRAHVDGCEECSQFVARLQAIEAALPEVETPDVSDEVVSRLLARGEMRQTSRRSLTSGRATLLGAVAAAMLVFVVLPLYQLRVADDVIHHYSDGGQVSGGSGGGEYRPNPENQPIDRLQKVDEERASGLRTPSSLPAETPQPPRGAAGVAEGLADAQALASRELEAELEPMQRRFEDDKNEAVEFGVPGGVIGGIVGGLPSDSEEKEMEKAQAEGQVALDQVVAEDEYDKLRSLGYIAGAEDEEAQGEADSVSETVEAPARDNAPQKRAHTEPVYPEPAQSSRVEGVVTLRIAIDAEGNVTEATILSGPPLLAPAAKDAVLQWKYAPSDAEVRELDVEVSFEIPEDDVAKQEARAFLKERAEIERLRFRTPKGYWSNTYLPGDARTRHLKYRLEKAAPDTLAVLGGAELSLHRAARPVAQPFDAPEQGALSVYLHADRRGIEARSRSRTRLLVQLGIQASEARARRRPPMNIGVVLDSRNPLSNDEAAYVRALLLSLNEARELGDRFRVVIPAPGGAKEIVSPDSFRHGALTLALEDALSRPSETNTIAPALRRAIESVHAADDPNRPLGTSLVIVVTPSMDSEDTQTMRKLRRLAHQSAVGGVSLSVVGLGRETSGDELDSLALAGQGRRYWVERSSDAPRVVERELSAASRAVARALRLRIRLAPGVSLIDVIGSRPLSETQASRVREAERSIDLRLSRNLGIEADRGDDEEGIQIVIPSFYASDSHTILLDVVADGPGPIAEVTARYKDLVRLENTVAKASLSLSEGEQTRGPLEMNVVKNFFAHRLAKELDAAAEEVASSQLATGRERLERFRRLIAGLSLLGELPQMARDRETVADVSMLDEYVRALNGNAAGIPQVRAYLADSLRYAGAKKRWLVPAL